MARDRQLNLKMTIDEAVRLERLSEHYGVSPQNVLRMLLKRESDSLPMGTNVRVAIPTNGATE